MATKPTSPAFQPGDPESAGLVAFLVAHEGSGTTVHDLCPSANDATFDGSAWTGSGLFSGPALNFAGAGTDVAILGSTSKWAQAGSFSVCLSVKLGVITSQTWVSCYGQTVGGHDTGWVIGSDDSASGKVKFVTFASTVGAEVGDTLLSATALTTGTSHDVVCTFDIATGSKKIYIDGVLDASSTWSSGPITYANGIATVGCISVGSTRAQPMTGVVDHVKVYSTAISQALVTDDHSDPFTAVRAVPASSVALSGPSSGPIGSESSAFTATLDQPAGSGGIVVGLASDGSGDVIHATTGGGPVTSITIPSGQTIGHFFLVAGTSGSRHVSITQGSLTISGSPVTFNASSSGPTTATLANSPTTCAVGAESASIVVTLNQASTGSGTVVNLASNGPGDVIHATTGGGSVTSITIPSGQTTGHFFLVAGTAGARNVSITSSGLTISGSPLAITASATPALSALPSTASGIDGGTPAFITATLVNSSATLSATVGRTGGGAAAGSISTPSPTSGTPFQYHFPADGSGSDTVTITDSTGTLSASCVVTYSPVDINVGFYCKIDQVPDFVDAPTMVIKDATSGQVVTPATGGAGLSLGNGVYVFPFTAPPGLYVGMVSAGGVTIASNAQTLARDVLPSDGLDAVDIDGVNLRQALAIIYAAIVGDNSGNQGPTLTYKAPGTETTRLTSTFDEFNNRSVTIFPPP